MCFILLKKKFRFKKHFMRPFFLFFGCFFLFIFEMSFLSSLPVPLRYIPWTFFFTLFVMHYVQMPSAGLWLLAKGWMDDYFHLGVIPFEGLLFSLLVLASYLLSKYIFSPRSFYGGIGLFFFNFFLFVFSQMGYLFWIGWRSTEQIHWEVFWSMQGWQFLWLFLLFSLFRFLLKQR